MCNRQNHGCIHEKLLMLSYMYVCTSLKADQGHIIFLEHRIPQSICLPFFDKHLSKYLNCNFYWYRDVSFDAGAQYKLSWLITRLDLPRRTRNLGP